MENHRGREGEKDNTRKREERERENKRGKEGE